MFRKLLVSLGNWKSALAAQRKQIRQEDPFFTEGNEGNEGGIKITIKSRNEESDGILGKFSG